MDNLPRLWEVLAKYGEESVYVENLRVEDVIYESVALEDKKQGCYHSRRS